MVNQVSHSTGGDHGLAIGSQVSMPPIYGQLSSHHGEDSFHSSQGGEHSHHKGNLITRFFGKIKEILRDAIALPVIMWRKFWGGGHDDHGGHGDSHASHGPVKILEDKGLLSGDMMDVSIAGSHGENAFLAREGALSGKESYL